MCEKEILCVREEVAHYVREYFCRDLSRSVTPVLSASSVLLFLTRGRVSFCAENFSLLYWRRLLLEHRVRLNNFMTSYSHLCIAEKGFRYVNILYLDFFRVAGHYTSGMYSPSCLWWQPGRVAERGQTHAPQSHRWDVITENTVNSIEVWGSERNIQIPFHLDYTYGELRQIV